MSGFLWQLSSEGCYRVNCETSEICDGVRPAPCANACLNSITAPHLGMVKLLGGYVGERFTAEGRYSGTVLRGLGEGGEFIGG